MLRKTSIFPSCKRGLHEIFVLPLCGRMEIIMKPVAADDGCIILDNANAVVTAAKYNSLTGYITDLACGKTKAVYTVGENVNGKFDVYIEVSKQVFGFGTTPFGIGINGGKEIVPIIEYEWCKEDKSDFYDKGVFLCLSNEELHEGDTITVSALSGFGFGSVSYQPEIGDILLYNTGTVVAVGYNRAIPEIKVIDKNDVLSGLKLVWLGSSVAYGQMAQGYSMADCLEDKHTLKSYKYCVSGTTLVDESSSSYISRMKQILTDIMPDYFLVQLSTNDASSNKPFGSLSSSQNKNDFDTKTIYGGLEYIIAYVSKTWDCPVIFFTGTYYDGDTYNNDGTAYKKTVRALLDVQEKWGITVINLYDNEANKEIYNTDEWKRYMWDGVHPKLEGYTKWWAPKFEEALKTVRNFKNMS